MTKIQGDEDQNSGVPSDETADGLVIALQCCEAQLTLVAGMLDEVASHAWNDVADACRKQAQVAHAALARAEGNAPERDAETRTKR